MIDRYDAVTSRLDLSNLGLEIAPYFNPVIKKSFAGLVHYTDYIDTEEIRLKARKNPALLGREVPAVDFVWQPGADIKDCAPVINYGFCVASHVIEHVPDTLGWLNQVLSVMRTDAGLALIVPDRRRTMDFYRQETTPADLIDNWLRRLIRPSPRQIFDYLSRAADDQAPAGERPFETGASFDTVRRHYSDSDALQYALHAWSFAEYLDVHCTVWSPESFVHAMVVACQLGILNVDVQNPIERENEFIIHLYKRGEPGRVRPAGEGCDVSPL